jgi:hypothetical protein
MKWKCIISAVVLHVVRSTTIDHVLALDLVAFDSSIFFKRAAHQRAENLIPTKCLSSLGQHHPASP